MLNAKVFQSGVSRAESERAIQRPDTEPKASMPASPRPSLNSRPRRPQGLACRHALVKLRPPLLLRRGDASTRGGAHLALRRRILRIPRLCRRARPFQLGSNLADLSFDLIPLYLIAGQRHL